MPRGIPTVTNFGAEFFDLIRSAEQQPVTFNLSRNDAYAFRHRLSAFRKALRAENHPLAVICNRLQFSLNDKLPNDRATLTIGPPDRKFAKLIRSMGITDEGTIDPLGNKPLIEDENLNHAERTIAEIMGEDKED